MASGGVGYHGLVLESVGLNQLLLLPPVLLSCIVIVQLVQALREEEESDGWKGGKEAKTRLALGTVTREIRLQEKESFKSLQAHKQPVGFLHSCSFSRISRIRGPFIKRARAV